MVAWDRVTRRDVLRAIHEYDQLAQKSSSLSMVSPLLRPMSWSWINAVTRLRQSWAQLMSSLQGNNFALVTSWVGRPAPLGCSAN